MTEQEAIEILSLNEKEKKLLKNLTPVYEVAINALEEIQQYRAIGTPEKIAEELNRLRNDNECQGLYFTLEERQDLARQHRELEEYKSIGTPEECRAAVEKQRAKKPTEKIENEIGYYHCANCDKTLRTTIHLRKPNYCLNCGQKLDWSEEE